MQATSLDQSVLSRRLGTLRSHVPEIAVLLSFLISRIAYAWVGLRFDAQPLWYFWQYIDPNLMRDDLLRSLFYLHMQPPGFNLFLGIIYKLFPENYAAAYHAVYLALGLAAALALLDLLKSLGIPVLLRTILVIFFFISPDCVLYENFLAYDYPSLCLLLISAALLFRLVDKPTVARSIWFFAMLFAATMLRNQFHLLFLVALVAALIAVRPRDWRAMAAGGVPVLLATVLLYFKNFLIVGAFNASTWLGMQTAVMTTHNLSKADIERLIDAKVLTPIARITEFSPLRYYRGFYTPPAATGIPIFDREESARGVPNYNNLAYLQIHKQYVPNSIAVLKHEPKAYIKGELIAWFTYFLPSSDFFQFEQLPLLQPFERIYSAVVFGQFRRASHQELRAMNAMGQGPAHLLPYTGTFLLVLLPVLFCFGVVYMLRGELAVAGRFTLGFMLFTILWVTAIANLLSAFENNRYRLCIDGYFVVLGALLLHRAGVLLSARRSNAAANS